MVVEVGSSVPFVSLIFILSISTITLRSTFKETGCCADLIGVVYHPSHPFDNPMVADGAQHRAVTRSMDWGSTMVVFGRGSSW